MKNRSKNIVSNVLVICIIVAAVLCFFAKLFFPTLHIFITPDFGQSDIFQLNLPAKFSLSTSLKNNTLPLWNPLIGNGFPQTAEGQIGTFNIINLIIFRFLPFPASYNIGLIITFAMAAFGAYCYARIIGFARVVGLFTCLIFAFSGFFVAHISHYNLVQSAAWIPWAFLFTHRLIYRKGKLIEVVKLAFVFSQQLFTGFPQISFITGIGLLLYVVMHVPLKKPDFNILLFFFGALGWAILLSAVYLLPAQELLNLSNRKGGFPVTYATYYSFEPKLLLTFFDPNYFGTPYNGSYPLFSKFGGNIFWENNGYIGVIPLLFVVLSFLHIRKNKAICVMWLFSIFAALLMFGKYSPFQFIYSIPPFSYFRAPSRFLILFVWAVCLLAGYGAQITWRYLNNRIKSRILLYSIIFSVFVIALAQLQSFAYFYHPIGDSSHWLERPDSTYLVQHNSTIYTIGNIELWNSVFLSRGWQDGTEPYWYFRNGLQANENLLYRIRSFQVYPILVTKRYGLIRGIIDKGIAFNKNSTVTITDTAMKFMKTAGITDIIAPYSINNLSPKQKVIPVHNQFPPYYIYTIPDTSPRIHGVTKYVLADTVENALTQLSTPSFDPKTTAVLEKKPAAIQFAPCTDAQNPFDFTWATDNAQEQILRVLSRCDGLLISTDSYYPGWKVYVDGKETTMYAANINQRAVAIEKGDHMVRFAYEPASFKIGLGISLANYLIVGIVLTQQAIQKLFSFQVSGRIRKRNS